jgi:1-acyl-sn-glycerol-3-phosphate acyltransferase
MRKEPLILKLAKIFIPPILNFLFNVKIYGKENLPQFGPYIIASNHFSNWDPPIIYYALYPIFPYTMAKKELFKFFPYNFILKSFRSFPVDRKNFKLSDIKFVKNIIDKKEILLMFPEGTRTKKKDILKIKIKSGTSYLAYNYNLNIIPIHIFWPFTPTKTFLKRASVEVFIKKPIYIDKIKNELIGNEKDIIEKLNEILTKEIRARF